MKGWVENLSRTAKAEGCKALPGPMGPSGYLKAGILPQSGVSLVVPYNLGLGRLLAAGIGTSRWIGSSYLFFLHSLELVASPMGPIPQMFFLFAKK